MRTPKFSTKRVLGLGLAAALAVGATVGVAANSWATTTPSVTLSPATGSDAGGTVISVKGKGFADSTGAVQVKAVAFTTAACTVDATSGTAATTFNVVTATKMVVTSPTLSPDGTFYVCAWNGTTSSQTILGQAKFVVGAPPTAGTIVGAASNIAKASSLGGTTVVLNGTHLDKTSKASIDGLAAKSTYVSASKLSVVLPAHATRTGLGIKVTSQFGTATSTDTVSYVAVAEVGPTSGDGTAGNVITLTGSGFSSLVFGAAATNQTVVFVPGGSTLTANSTTLASLHPCTSVVVESDTSLSCQAPTLAAGAYTAMIVANGSTPADYGSTTTQISKSATYTVATL